MTRRRNERPPRCLDLFCGIGGLALGLERAGVHSVGGIDCWADAKRTFERNLAPLQCLKADLATVTVPEIESFFRVSAADIDMVAGGPPCQGFSTVGRRDSGDPRNRLWTHF